MGSVMWWMVGRKWERPEQTVKDGLGLHGKHDGYEGEIYSNTSSE